MRSENNNNNINNIISQNNNNPKNANPQSTEKIILNNSTIDFYPDILKKLQQVEEIFRLALQNTHLSKIYHQPLKSSLLLQVVIRSYYERNNESFVNDAKVHTELVNLIEVLTAESSAAFEENLKNYQIERNNSLRTNGAALAGLVVYVISAGAYYGVTQNKLQADTDYYQNSSEYNYTVPYSTQTANNQLDNQATISLSVSLIALAVPFIIYFLVSYPYNNNKYERDQTKSTGGHAAKHLTTLPDKVLDILGAPEDNKKEIYSLYEAVLIMIQIKEVGEKRNIEDFSQVAGLEVMGIQAYNFSSLLRVDFEKIEQKDTFEEIMYLFENEGSKLKDFLQKLNDLGQKINLAPLLSDEEQKKVRKINFPFNIFSKKSTDEAVPSPKADV